jgi:CHAD domain-containing protein
VRHVFPAAMLDRYATARAYETVLAIPDVPVAVLHLLRIDCKRMRYVLEPITHLLGESGDELVKTLKRLQDALGELNDAEVAKTRLLAMAVQGRGGPGLAEYIGHQDHELARWREEVPGRWEPFVGEAYRQALAESAARM